jgi:hypothetical protein
VVVRNLAGVEERVLVFDFRRQNRSCPWLGDLPWGCGPRGRMETKREVSGCGRATGSRASA